VFSDTINTGIYVIEARSWRSVSASPEITRKYAPVRPALRPRPARFTRAKTRKHLPADSQLLLLRERLKHTRDEATIELVVPELPLKSAAAAMPQIRDVVGDAVATIERSLPYLPVIRSHVT
jgi:hypothetical protein